MIVVVLIAAGWLVAFVVAFVLILALCRAASIGDRMNDARKDRG
jgi:hypothetical protein